MNELGEYLAKQCEASRKAVREFATHRPPGPTARDFEVAAAEHMAKAFEWYSNTMRDIAERNRISRQSFSSVNPSRLLRDAMPSRPAIQAPKKRIGFQ